eukprot:tig00000319_g24132.t1
MSKQTASAADNTVRRTWNLSQYVEQPKDIDPSKIIDEDTYLDDEDADNPTRNMPGNKYIPRPKKKKDGAETAGSESEDDSKPKPLHCVTCDLDLPDPAAFLNHLISSEHADALSRSALPAKAIVKSINEKFDNKKKGKDKEDSPSGAPQQIQVNLDDRVKRRIEEEQKEKEAKKKAKAESKKKADAEAAAKVAEEEQAAMYAAMGLPGGRSAQSHLKFGKRVGVGGFAETFKGWWQGRVVAIKKIIQVADRPLTEDDLEDFKSELALMAKLSHENIVQCHGGGDHLPDLFIVMEFCARGSLASLLRKDKTAILDFEAVRRIALGVARGVAYLHALDPPLIHRDLKCENVFLTDDLTPKIGDFGVSVQTGASYMMSESGTYQYMAPELLRGERSNELVDVYSFAMLLYELVTRRVPYSDMGLQSGVAGFRAAYSGLRPSLEDCPWPELADLISDCWADAPSARPQMCQIVVRLQHLVGTTRPVPPKEEKKEEEKKEGRRSLEVPRNQGLHASPSPVHRPLPSASAPKPRPLPGPSPAVHPVFVTPL